MKNKIILPILLMGFVLMSACAPSSAVTPTLALPSTATLTTLTASTVIPTITPGLLTTTPGGVGVTAIASPISTSLPTVDICADPQVTTLINSLKTAMLSADGPLFSSLVSPTRGLDAANFRDGNVINYAPEQAKFLFETTFEVNWGPAPGSGEDKVGSFHDVIVPEMVKAFNQPYTLHCNELKHGGATYEVSWPYQGDFYSVHFPGTEANGSMDWHTWAVGIEYVNNKPYIYALIPYFWEP